MKTIFGGKTGMVLLLLVVLLLAGLPVAVWLDLTNLAETNLKRQASDLNSIISSVRSYYASNVVGRILAAPGVPTKVAHNYEAIPGAIPIPATLSLELGKVISEQQHNIAYRFVSDYPFANRAPHPLGNVLFAFKYLLAYFVLVAAVGFIFIALQRRQAAVIQAMNAELETANEFLASMSMKISRY